MLFAVLSSKIRSHLSATVDTAKMNCVLILDENHGVTDHFVWVWAVWLNGWRKVEKVKKEMVCSGMRVDEF